jgi:hypothetical protein
MQFLFILRIKLNISIGALDFILKNLESFNYIIESYFKL